MFYEIYNNPITKNSTILNVKTGNVFELSNYFRQKRVDIQDRKKLHFGLLQEDSRYKIYLGSYGPCIYSGRFPVLCENTLLFSHEIRIKEIFYMKTGILIQVRCNCWGAFEMELPLYMEQAIFLDSSSGRLENGKLVATTYTPFMIFNKKEDLKNIEKYVNIPRSMCFTNFNDLSYCKTKNELKFYGYVLSPITLSKLSKPINILDNMRGF